MLLMVTAVVLECKDYLVLWEIWDYLLMDPLPLARVTATVMAKAKAKAKVKEVLVEDTKERGLTLINLRAMGEWTTELLVEMKQTKRGSLEKSEMLVEWAAGPVVVR